MSNRMPKALRTAFLSWNLRNLLGASLIPGSGQRGLVCSRPGEYPVNGWRPHLMEVPARGRKKDLAGRYHQAYGHMVKSPNVNHNRVVHLPIYDTHHEMDLQELGLLISYWGELCLPDDIPCIAIAVMANGLYLEDREAQSVTALLVWSDPVARVLSFDWTEGPMEDCVSPEWYMEASPLLNLSESVERMHGLYRNPLWRGTRFSLFVIPPCLGHGIPNDPLRNADSPWSCEWRYSDYGELEQDLERVLDEVGGVFDE